MNLLRYLVPALGLLLWTLPAQAIPIQNLPNLVSITVFERTFAGGPTPFNFGPADAAILQRRAVPLSAANNDFVGFTGEFYDVFYSDADGTLNVLGEYLTVEARFDNAGGGGHNLAEVVLNFSGGGTENANQVASFAAFGAGSFPGTVGLAVDGDLDTHTFMGSTAAGVPDRLRVTVGFASSVTQVSQVSEPGTFALLGLGLGGLVLARRRRSRRV